MSELRSEPPKDVEAGASHHRDGRPTTNTTSPPQADPAEFRRYDGLRGNARRRAAAVRLPGENPDPLHPGHRYHRPSTGLRASGYREGYFAALQWVLLESSGCVDEPLRAEITAILKRANG
jgi:hypothetical protein